MYDDRENKREDLDDPKQANSEKIEKKRQSV